MKDVKPWLAGPATTFAKAFPTIKSIAIEVVQDHNGWYFTDVGSAISRFNSCNIRDHVPCGNRLCERGGYNLQNLIRVMTDGRKTEETDYQHCLGDDGSPKGRRKGQECMNSFTVTVRIAYQ